MLRFFALRCSQTAVSSSTRSTTLAIRRSLSTHATFTQGQGQGQIRMSSTDTQPKNETQDPPPLIHRGAIAQDRYILRHCIHKTDTGSIWLVEDTKESGFYSLKAKLRTGRIIPPCECPSESALLQQATQYDHPGFNLIPHVVEDFGLLESDGREYDCFVGTLYSREVTSLSRPNLISLPWKVMKQVVFEVLVALDYAHTKLGIVHGDIKMDNMLLATPSNRDDFIRHWLRNRTAEDQEKTGPVPFPLPDPDKVTVALTDWELGHSVDRAEYHDFSIQPDSLRAPEVILGNKWGPPADIWNLGCIIYEMATSRMLFTPNPAVRDETSVVLRMLELLNEFPPYMIQTGKYAHKFFTPEGQLRPPLQKPEHLPLPVLIYYQLTSEEIERPEDIQALSKPEKREELGDFLDFMVEALKIDPNERASALTLLQHRWLNETAQDVLFRFARENGEEIPEGSELKEKDKEEEPKSMKDLD
ncbi:kinase-like protein [Panus rudis PR-1116 ss-1]|nr:kinase-like protein [Panus rudis PR-1116 ss-1]